MAKFLLNTAFVEEDFFSDSRLIAVGSALKGHSLCWWINELFGLKFVREPEMDICIHEGRVSSGSGTLFDELPEEEVKRKYHFPVYRHALPYFDAAFYLYANRCSVKKLVPELKHADYLLLIQFASYIEPEQDFSFDLVKVNGVAWTSELEIASLKSRRNLII
ncbi:IPExxxVDY family protein [Taibaiella koreensis]|uniref:IPExxxVDY family protein n=1 Tax=Taibaiella koreensis TaxID=1268548 RepID=UPI000E59A687|nr:IPExxxVDY family protein [Taibaiella koreensis]